MSFVPADQAVRDRVTGDLGANLCVEAGAGTGKTTVLVDRVVEVLRTGAATVDEMAVMTFTEAAAAELATRIRQRLERARERAGDAERARIEAALAGLHRAHIETIHAFAASMLRERPVEAGLDPGFEVLDGLTAELAFSAAFDAWIRDLLAGGGAALALAIRRGFDLKEIRKLADAVHAHRALLPLAAHRAPASPAALALPMDEAAAECRRLLAEAGRDEVATVDMAAIVGFASALADEDERDRTILFGAPRLSPGRGRQSDWDDPGDCRASKALRKEVKGAIEAAQAALRTETLLAVLPLVEDFVRAHEAERRAAGQADFDDLLAWAREMLARSPEARAYFRRRFRVILVDEFQDTDPVQAEIALCIASDDEPGAEWLHMRPRPGALCVVGDPKQSIYRFRRADIAIYDAVRVGPLGGGEARLTQNFRSTGGVLDWVNRVFDEVLQAEIGVQPGNTRLEPGPDGLGDGTLSVCVVHGRPADSTADGIRAEEARLLATLIRRAVEEGWPVRDPGSGEERPMEYGDVAVLLPRRTALDLYLDAFRRAGVPVRAEGGRSFFQRQEVRDLANLLLAIDEPLDRVALVGSLRAAVFGCTDEEMFLHVARGNQLDYRLDHEGSPASVAEAMDLLRDLHDLRSRVSLALLVRAVLERTRMVEIALAGWDGPQSAANLVKLADRARAFSAAGAGGLRGFARWLVEQRAASDEAEASIAEETDDVVQVMTIHASKGLEFPVVALANLQTRPRTDVDPVPDRAADLLHIRVLKGQAEFITPGFEAIWEEEKHRRAAEEKRLLYVASTRARDRLIVPFACEVPAGGSMLLDLVPFLPTWDPGAAGDLVDGCHVVDRDALPDLPEEDPPLPVPAPEADVDQALVDRDAWAAEREAVLAAASAGLEVHPATRDEGDEPVPAFLAGAGDRPLIASTADAPPRAKGEAMHKALELIDLLDPREVPETVLSVCVLAGIEDAADEVLAMVEACLASPVVARARRAGKVWREVPYTLRISDGYATGRIDLVFQEGEELVVVDWKSDSVGPGDVGQAVEADRAQGEAYVRALSASTDLRVREVIFVFPRARAECPLRLQA